MYISVAHDREGQLRIYLNDGPIHKNQAPNVDGVKPFAEDDVFVCTEALPAPVIETYMELIMDAIEAWVNPLDITTWEKVEGQNSPATPRKAFGYNATHRELWAIEYDKDGLKRSASLEDTGSRGVISTTFITTVVKLFLTDLQATLDAQAKMEFPDPRPKGQWARTYKKGVKDV